MARSHLLKELDHIYHENLISWEQHQAITEYLRERKRFLGKNVPIIPLLGVFLVCSGVIAIGASNWRYFPDPLRIFLGFLPLLILSVLLVLKKDRSHLLAECLAIAVGLMELFAMAVVANIYQTPVETELLLRLAIASLIPTVYLLNGYWLACLLLAGTLLGASESHLVISVLGLCAFLPYYIEKLQEGQMARVLTCLHIMTSFRLALLIYPETVSLSITFSVLYLIGQFLENPFYQRLLTMASLGILAVTSFVPSILGEFEREIMISGVILFLTAVGIGCRYYVKIAGEQYYELTMRDHFIAFVHVSAILTLSLCLLSLHLRFIPAVISFGLLIAYLNYCQHEGESKQYYGCSFALSAYILAQMSVLGLPFILNGLVFIGIGSTLLVTSFVKRKKEGEFYDQD